MQPDDLMIQLIDELSRAQGRLAPVIESFIERGDPTGLLNLVLVAVVRAGTPPTVPQIGRSLGYQRQTIQRQADILADLGFVSWIDNPDHKSSHRLVPTDQGRAIYEKASSKSRQWAARFAADQDTHRLAETVATLRTIRAKLEAEARNLP